MQMQLKLATYLARELVANTVLTDNRKRAGCKCSFNWQQKEAVSGSGKDCTDIKKSNLLC